METIVVSQQVSIFYNSGHEELAGEMEKAFKEALPLTGELWGLDVPGRMRLYVAVSMPQFVFHSSPWLKKIFLLKLFPFWYFKAKKIWAIAGGWNMGGKNPVVAVKPPELFKTGATSMGKIIYVDEPDDMKRFRRYVVHETVHAFSSFQRLPLWLNEGMAVVTEDRYNGSPVIKKETLERLKPRQDDMADKPGEYRQLNRMTEDVIIGNFVRGYWLTRFLEEAHPGFLKDLLKQPLKGNHQVIDQKIASLLNIPAAELWKKIDIVILDFFCR